MLATTCRLVEYVRRTSFGLPLAEEVFRIVSRQVRQGQFDTALTHLSYLTMPDAYLSFVSSLNYSTAGNQLAAIARWQIPNTIRSLPRIGIIDLGIGNADAGCAILKRFGGVVTSYTGIDLSKSMLDRGIANIARQFPELPSLGVVGRFDNEEFKDCLASVTCSGHAQVFLLLGNTFGNFEANLLIENFRRASEIFPNSQPLFLVIGMEMGNAAQCQRYQAEYDTPENLALTVSPLGLLGIEPAFGKVQVEFNVGLSRIEEWFVLGRDVTIVFGADLLELPARTRILTSFTAKPSELQLREFLTAQLITQNKPDFFTSDSELGERFMLATVRLR